MTSKILVIGSQHGNEVLGEQLYEYILGQKSELIPYITFVIGNPRAHRQKVRCIESDMNRSYTGDNGTYEERRAKRLLQRIVREKYDLVLDLHTTTCDQDPCIIVPGFNKTINRFLRSSHIRNVVALSPKLASNSLIGVYPQAISIEVFQGKVDEGILRHICNDIKAYISDIPGNRDKKVYYVDNLLYKNEITDSQLLKLRNFEMSEMGYIPILVGEDAYKETDYLGFKAYRKDTIKV